MKDNNVTTKGGVGFFGLLSILFIGLKLGQVINWSWIWVLAPLWMPTCSVIGLIVIIALICGVYSAIKK